MAIEAFIRFADSDGTENYGEVSQQQLACDLRGVSVPILEGTPWTGFKRLDQQKTVCQVLCPLEKTPLIICIGLNYKQHAEESKHEISEYPVVFTKPPDALAGPFDVIKVHPDAQSYLDYEAELTVIVGRDAKNVQASKALSYVLGYTNGNDVSARNFQAPNASGGQFCYAKSFDSFAPIGPAVVLASKITDPQNLRLYSKVNGGIRQETNTNDMIWTVSQLIEHLSRGTTLRAGTVIMTGTPSGVGIFMEPRGMVGHGDVVHVGMDGLGELANEFDFEK
ncbi:uncharacterized protein A1O9_07269 [Exophiala aquamarina CBS 119918]|uniref:Fumarylacetoacetase-like C-terminal domain-containing protein n=1 Tax=Exophiala aquamarina CBS 119918 TaxID=1182545 RepID=A0A072PAD4_9EURO|nr:uncharacterized protein A1O9_07269 [Exophiala aquamarina CBS 119918]KEF57079.1 hypothetical protein A1O9_07269 [Exophiala aquamarina CBS 119918]